MSIWPILDHILSPGPKFWRRGPYKLPLACLVLWQVHTILGKNVWVFDMALFDFLWPVWALQMCLFMIIFANICKYCQVLCCCVLRPSIFDVYRLFAQFTKSVCTEITIFFHFFRSIASCDHQLTSEGQLLLPFSLLLEFCCFHKILIIRYLQI